MPDDAAPPLEPLAFDRSAVVLVIVAGIVAALHVGKVPISLPEMERSFDRDLAALSWLMSMFALVGVFGGMAAGVLAQRFGDRRMMVVGLAVLGLSSLIGAGVSGYPALMVSRIVEGLGFLVTVVAAPAILNRLTPPAHRGLVFGLWGSFMPVGIALSMGIGPLLGSWPRLWVLDGVLALVMAAWVARRVPAATGPDQGALAGVGRVLRSRRTWLLALGFGVYNLQFFTMMTFLPSFLMSKVGLTVAEAGSVSAVIVLANAVGNVIGGAALQRGLTDASLMIGACAVCGLLGALTLASFTPGAWVVGLAVLFSASAGVLPACFLASAPRSVPDLQLAPMGLGLVMQGNYLGQVLAPVQAGVLLAAFGWPAVGLQIGLAGLIGIALAVCYRRSPPP